MQLIDDQPVFSATDLVGYLACEHLSALERAALARLVQRPDRADPELDVIRRRGEQHERRYLESLEADGMRVRRIERQDGEEQGDRLRRQAAETIAAMADGVDVVYQATFFDGRWLGYADFLLRIESSSRPSVWGPYHYEVADTKLARHVKAGAVLQMCSYVDALSPIQRVQPETMHVVLGGGARETAHLRVEDYMAYYRAARARFEETVLGSDVAPVAPAAYPPAATYPEPVEHCGVCRWAELCQVRRRDDDHLSLVAGITARQRKALVARELSTVERLAAAPIPFDPPLDGTSASSVERVREQARIQIAGRGLAKPIHELLMPRDGEPVEPERGLAILPAPDAGDLFLDLEGDPYAFDEGVDYLFGVMDTAEQFTAFWALDPDRPAEVSLAGEKRAFERLVDFIADRHERFPGMHVYHYASYEPTALKRLMGRHATREDEVDRLLRGGVLVDLFRAVRQGLRASVESYSIKKIEALYDFERSEGLRDAGSSIVEFERWLELDDTQRPSSDILASIEAYNRDDVLSTMRLRDWLEAQRIWLAQRTGQEVPRPAPRSPDAPEQLREADARVALVVEQLTDGLIGVPTERGPDHARWLLAQLLSWHRREAKVAFWDFFHRMGMDVPELTADKEALGPLEVVGAVGEPFKPSPRARFVRQRWRYRFAAQDHDVGPKSDIYDPRRYRAAPGAKWSTWKVPAENLVVDETSSTIEFDLPAVEEPEHPEALVPMNIYGDREQRAALLRLGEWVAVNAIDAPGPYRSARDLLLGLPPSIGQPTGGPLRAVGESELDAARRIVNEMEPGTLAIQGPPGAGKTYAGARMVVQLLAGGKRVGITANSHKVIGNLLREVLSAADGVDVRPVQKVTELTDALDDPRVHVMTRNEDVQAGLAAGTFNLAAGTPWLWAPAGSEGLVDVLFVDEAGQMALANAVAVSGAGRSLVLLGDPQQLDQPLQGSHPPGAERSALAHLLGGHDAMPPHLGLFLEHTWRLHPHVTRYTSEAFYEGRLDSRPELANQRLDAPAPMRGTGVRLLTVDHVGAESESPEEARQVAALVRALVASGSTWVDAKGARHRLEYADVLVVAPYNAQVGAIQRELPEARVGTVDKFQGQEAPVSIYSMTSSSPEDAPRGMDFLYSRNRLNVATSRARCVAIVVTEPALLRVRARTPKQMRLANALCLFAEMAVAQTPR